jgi:transglutaminase-like putative cysteine protease
MKVVTGAVAGLVVLLGVGRAYASADKVPDWVRTEAQQKLPDLPPNTKSVVLLDEHTYTVEPNGQATEHVRYVVKILRPQGREDAVPAVWSDKDDKLLSMHVWSIDPTGKEYAVKDNEMREYSPPGEGGELYVDVKAKIANPPGRDPGGVVAYEYEQRERPYVAETNWFFQDDTPRVHQSFTLVLPQGYTYSTTWANHDPVKGIDLENRKYRWEMNDESAIDLEQVPLRPSGSALAARLTIHYAGPGLAEPAEGTWQGVGEWFDALAHDREAPTPEITAKAQELVAGKTDFYDRAEAIGNFVQKQIRYFVIEMGIGGYQPHQAGEIFKGHYGDCKDKATLLAAMLSSVGLHSDIVLVDTRRGFVNPDAPSIMGDHAIAAIEVPAGYESAKMHSLVTAKSGKRYLIFDPTWEETPFGQVENDLQGSYGVLVEGAQSQLIQIPVMSPELNTVKRAGTFTLSADGSLKGEVTDERFGDIAERRRSEYRKEDAQKQEEFLRKQAGRDLMSVSLSGIKVANLEALNKDLTTQFDVQASHYASATGPLLMLRPRVLGSYELNVDHKPRKVVIDLYETMQGTDTFDIEIPEGYVVDELPDPVKEEFGFATYESSTVVHGRTLHYSRTYTLRAVTLPANKYADVQRLASVIGADEAGQVVLKKQ